MSVKDTQTLANAPINSINKVDTSRAKGLVKTPQDASGLFSSLNSYDEDIFHCSFDLSKLDTSETKNMSKMFANLIIDGDLDLSKFDTSNVTDMSDMFDSIDTKQIDLSKWNTANVTNMNSMFKNTKHLNNIDLSSFDTSNVTDMGNMFQNNSLNSISINNFDTSNVTNMQDMFEGSQFLQNIDISNFDMSKVKGSTNIFRNDKHLQSITLGVKNKFQNEDILPSGNAATTWSNVGTGTIDKPQGDLQFSAADTSGQSLAKYYDGTGKQGTETFVPYASTDDPNKTADVTIQSNLGDKIVKGVKGKIGSIIKVPIPLLCNEKWDFIFS